MGNTKKQVSNRAISIAAQYADVMFGAVKRLYFSSNTWWSMREKKTILPFQYRTYLFYDYKTIYCISFL